MPEGNHVRQPDPFREHSGGVDERLTEVDPRDMACISRGQESCRATEAAVEFEHVHARVDSQRLGEFLSLEGRTMLGDELLERHRLASADLLDHVIRAGKDTVLVIDRDLSQMLERKESPKLGFLLESRRTWPWRIAWRVSAGLVFELLEVDPLVLDVLAQHPAHDLAISS